MGIACCSFGSVSEVPFILPIIPALNVKFDLLVEMKDMDTKHDRFLNPEKLASSTLFAKMLAKSENEANYEAGIEKLKSLSLLAITFESSSLSPDHGGSLGHLLKFVEM
ncbi:hypothetical protein V9T40_004310 [Parthenolecanium corni]|uniref:WDR36/Utp21 C-terminal domain-containing protein n=1 Tax=Parthenolecanium corni TaxID=536013 RepID=A0AAN9YAM6_9HEMI